MSTPLSPEAARAFRERQAAYVRKMRGFDDRAADPYPDPLRDPVGYMNALDEDLANAKADALLDIASRPAEEVTFEDIMAENDAWIAAKKRRTAPLSPFTKPQ